jgi:orotidine-5'-phosphate decarboxylase
VSVVVMVVFSVGRESLSGVFVLAVVVNATNENTDDGGGVSAEDVSDQLVGVSSVEVSCGEVGVVLRALERQGLVRQDGMCFVASEEGCKRVEMLVDDVGRVAGGNGCEDRALLVE